MKEFFLIFRLEEAVAAKVWLMWRPDQPALCPNSWDMILKEEKLMKSPKKI